MSHQANDRHVKSIQIACKQRGAWTSCGARVRALVAECARAAAACKGAVAYIFPLEGSQCCVKVLWMCFMWMVQVWIAPARRWVSSTSPPLSGRHARATSAGSLFGSIAPSNLLSGCCGRPRAAICGRLLEGRGGHQQAAAARRGRCTSKRTSRTTLRRRPALWQRMHEREEV